MLSPYVQACEKNAFPFSSTGAVSTKRGMISENVVSENVVAFFQFIQKEESNRIGIFISLGNLEKKYLQGTHLLFSVCGRGEK